jgi:hypothetical protein
MKDKRIKRQKRRLAREHLQPIVLTNYQKKVASIKVLMDRVDRFVKDSGVSQKLEAAGIERSDLLKAFFKRNNKKKE